MASRYDVALQSCPFRWFQRSTRRHHPDKVVPFRDRVFIDPARDMALGAAAGKNLPALLQPRCIRHLRPSFTHNLLCRGKSGVGAASTASQEQETNGKKQKEQSHQPRNALKTEPQNQPSLDIDF